LPLPSSFLVARASLRLCSRQALARERRRILPRCGSSLVLSASNSAFQGCLRRRVGYLQFPCFGDHLYQLSPPDDGRRRSASPLCDPRPRAWRCSARFPFCSGRIRHGSAGGELIREKSKSRSTGIIAPADVPKSRKETRTVRDSRAARGGRNGRGLSCP
jgi:hypothetical protein